MTRGLNYGDNVSLPGNLYTGGAVTLNSDPYANFYVQQHARQQAQEGAMYKYFGELGKGLTPTGMYGNDISGLMQRKNEWQQFMMQNRKAIARPTLDQGKAYSEAMGRYNDMLGYIANSKGKVKSLMAVEPVLRSPNKKALLNESTLLSIHHGSLPLDHPDYQPFDPSAIDYNPPPFDIKDQNALKNSLSTYKATEVGNPDIRPLGNNQQQITHNYKFNDNQLNGIAAQGAMQYHTSPKFKNMIDENNTPEAYHNLNNIYKEHYGKDISSGEDMSAAYLLSIHPDISNKTEIRNVPISPWESAAARLSTEKGFYDYKQQSDQAEGAKVTGTYMANLENQAKQKEPSYYVHNGVPVGKMYQMPMNAELQKAFSIKSPDGKTTYQPNEMHILDNGDWLPAFYKYEKYTGPDNKTHSRPVIGSDGMPEFDKQLTQPVSRDIAKTNLDQVLLTKKSAEKQVGVGTPAAPSTIPAPPPAAKPKKQVFGSGGLN